LSGVVTLNGAAATSRRHRRGPRRAHGDRAPVLAYL